MWVVGTTNSVEVMLFHEAQISFDQFETFRVTSFWIMFMLVHTPDQEWFPIKAELSSSDFDFSETNIVALDLEGSAVLIQQQHQNPI